MKKYYSVLSFRNNMEAVYNNTDDVVQIVVVVVAALLLFCLCITNVYYAYMYIQYEQRIYIDLSFQQMDKERFDVNYCQNLHI